MGAAAHGPTIQIYTAGNGALHSCSWRVRHMTTLKLQSHWSTQTPFSGLRIVSKFTRPLLPPQGWGLGTRLALHNQKTLSRIQQECAHGMTKHYSFPLAQRQDYQAYGNQENIVSTFPTPLSCYTVGSGDETNVAHIIPIPTNIPIKKWVHCIKLELAKNSII